MAVVNFVMNYYIWFLVGIILILLAIIGAYADKTNFGQGKKEEKNDKSISLNDIKDIKINEAINKDNDIQINSGITKENIDNQNNVVKDIQDNTSNSVDIQHSNLNNYKVSIDNNANIKEETLSNNKEEISSKSLNLDEKLDKLNIEIQNILPEKELIDSSLLEDISDISLDSENNIVSKKGDYLNFNDLKLPEIKKPKKEIEDVWKK